MGIYIIIGIAIFCTAWVIQSYIKGRSMRALMKEFLPLFESVMLKKEGVLDRFVTVLERLLEEYLLKKKE